MRTFRRIAALVLCLSILLGGIPSAFARYSNINFIAISIGIKDSGQVTVESTVDARDCTSVEQRAELQKWTGTKWEPVPGGKTVVSQGTLSWLHDSGWGVSSGQYRAMIYVTIYVGTTVVERVQEHSNVVVR